MARVVSITIAAGILLTAAFVAACSSSNGLYIS